MSENVAPQGISAADEQLRSELLHRAEQQGGAIVQVAGDDQGAPYAFTVGAWQRLRIAEAVVIGLPAEMSTVLLTAYMDKAARGERFRPGAIYRGFFEGVPVAFERVAKERYPEFFGSALLIYPRADFPALQIVVPTPEGNWPWQPEAPPGFSDWQPILTYSGKPESRALIADSER